MLTLQILPGNNVAHQKGEPKLISTTDRPSPVKFTQTPPKLNIEQPRYNMEKSKLLSLTVNQDSSDVNKEDDPEVSSITGSVTGIEKLHLSTRHITPQVFINQQEHHFTMN